LLLDQQVKVYVFSAVRWEQDFFSLASHEKGKLFSGFTTFQTFQESMTRRDSLSLSAILKSTSVSVCFRRISRLPSAFVFLRWFKLAHISIQVCTFHDGFKQGIDFKQVILLVS